MTFLTVFTLLVLVFVIVKRENVAWGQVFLGMVLTFLLLGTFVGPHLQDFMQSLGGLAEDSVTSLWRAATD